MLFLRLIILVPILFCSGVVYAQSVPPIERDVVTDPEVLQAEQKAQEEARAAKAAEEQARLEDEAARAEEVFIPTEEISEDKPVPFPVDI